MEKKTSLTVLPLFPLPLVLFPQMKLPLHIFEPRYREMIGNCISTKSPFGVVLSQEQAIQSVGCSARVVEVLNRHPTGEFDIMTIGVERFRITEVSHEKSYLEGMVEFFEDSPPAGGLNGVSDQLEEVFDLCRRLLRSENQTEALRAFAKGHSGRPSFLLSNHLGFDLNFQQDMLQMTSESERLERMIDRLLRIVGPEAALAAKGFLEGESWFHRN